LNSNENNIGDKGLSHLRNGLERLKKLEKFRMHLSSARQITDKGFEKLGKGLEKLVFLQEIFILFQKSEKITNKGALSFCKALKKLQRLKNFDLNLPGCVDFNENGLYRICHVLKDIPSLEVIRFQQRHRSFFLRGHSGVLDALKTPAIPFPNYKEIPKKSNETFVLVSLCVILLISFIFFGYHSF